ncbi:leucine-rich melanocyte differentiation-associated protein-like isoform X2 [Coccinella septempunctata]|nr:leucine-rich melanocyte differentiation-associated protein-like isoform X2 [Coccinella septempunctata]XP_044756642.1 leucine-rich melanocyte differentiation-associated protein-like isoform X2 [Coccinella septempunctata]
MTALKDYMWGDPIEEALDKALNEDAALQRLSLAYEDLKTFPQVILDKVADSTKILDISYNNIKDFSFLSKMSKLRSLICDHNRIYSDVQMPYLPNLELFWMNHCDLKELVPFCKTIQKSFPNLKYLSLMGNKAVPSLLRGDKIYDCQQYRIFIISLFPRLIHLDESRVTFQEREEANEMKNKSLMNKYLPSANSYLKRTSSKLEGMLLGSPSQFETNAIV